MPPGRTAKVTRIIRTLFAFVGFVAFVVPSSGGRAFAAPQPVPSDLSKVQLRVGILRNGRYSIEMMPLETYVSRVVAGEAARDSRPAALEALAITVRTFALANRGRHRADGFDLCDQTHCQVVRTATAATDRAATATAGRLLMHGGGLASIYYTASCGGRTEIPSAVWPGADDPPYLPSQKDDACGGTPVWSADLKGADVGLALARAGFRGDLREMRIAARDGSGRVARLRLEGLTPDQISGQDLRVAVGRTLGWLLIKSTAFELRSDGRGKSAAYHFSGRGSGHGVGLCVIGSAHLAAGGATADAILARYFPGARIESPGPMLVASRRDPGGIAAPRASVARVATPSPEILLSLPDDDEGERAQITAMALAARDELARALGVPAPRQITIRFHATIDEYAQATGEPWFTSGAVVGGELHLVPLTVLRDRGELDRTIRHEIVHLLTGELLKSRPLWVREGVAIHFAGERPLPEGLSSGRRQPKGGCPSDTDLRAPVSGGALASAYARARACVEKEIASGKSWKDVK